MDLIQFKEFYIFNPNYVKSFHISQKLNETLIDSTVITIYLVFKRDNCFAYYNNHHQTKQY